MLKYKFENGLLGIFLHELDIYHIYVYDRQEQVVYICYLQTERVELLVASWYHSKDDDEEGCEAECKELPKPSPCENQTEAEDMCIHLKDINGPLKVVLYNL